jgi:hypothetical protein
LQGRRYYILYRRAAESRRISGALGETKKIVLMTTSIPDQWNDLPNIGARSAQLLEGLSQCALAESDVDQITMLLPADGLVSLIAVPRDPVSRELLLALGRVLAAHALVSGSRLHPTDFLAASPTAAATGTAVNGAAKVAANISTVEPGITRACLQADGEAALVFLTRDAVMPLVWVIFSRDEPRDALLIAVARLLVDHRLACVDGRDFP